MPTQNHLTHTDPEKSLDPSVHTGRHGGTPGGAATTSGGRPSGSWTRTTVILSRMSILTTRAEGTFYCMYVH